MKCRICKKKIKAPECYWKSYDCCSACIRKVAIEIQKKEEKPENIIGECDCFDEFVEKSGLDPDIALDYWEEYWSKYI